MFADALRLLLQVNAAEYQERLRLVSTQIKSSPQTPLEQAVGWVEHAVDLSRIHGGGSGVGEYLKPAELEASLADFLCLDLFLILTMCILLLDTAFFILFKKLLFGRWWNPTDFGVSKT